MKEKFIRIFSTDNIEMCGILYTPEVNTNKVVVHVHGLAGNFYENRFVSYLAEMYTKIGYSFLTFNNRGYGYFTDLLKGKNDTTFIPGGAYTEIFEECILDIKGAVNYLDTLGYNEYILQGHSYGCNKVVYYNYKEADSRIKKIILLAPCDVFAEFKREYNSDYESYITECRNKVNLGKGEEVIFNTTFPPMAFTAKTLVNNFLENVPGDIFRYRDYTYINEMLANINIPVITVIGETDSYVLTEEKDIVDNYLKNNIKDLKIMYIKNSGHVYMDREEELANILSLSI